MADHCWHAVNTSACSALAGSDSRCRMQVPAQMWPAWSNGPGGASMGRNRKDGDPLGLAGTRLAYRRGKFWYRHRGTDRFECVGADIVHAKRRAALYNDPGALYGTVRYWMSMFIVDCEQRVKTKQLAQRTLDDYRGCTEEGRPLIIYFGAMLPEDIKPAHVQAYLNKGAEDGRPVPANRERACLSSMLSWLLRRPDSPILVNPCMQRSGVVRNAEAKRERYVTHDEYREVWDVATRSERLLMEATYRTLQRPESDIILWTTANLTVEAGRRVLVFKQNKTGRAHRIALSESLDDLIPRTAKVVKLSDPHEPLVRRLDGGFYSYDGLSSMLKRSIETANERRKSRGVAPMPSFGYRDLKGKGATDMYFIDKVPIERIQQLLGHSNVTTTEIYIKARWRETAQPNMVSLTS
jgi:integrase